MEQGEALRGPLAATVAEVTLLQHLQRGHGDAETQACFGCRTPASPAGSPGMGHGPGATGHTSGESSCRHSHSWAVIH